MSVETIPQYLHRIWLKDLTKGGTGWRETREVADFYGIPVREARRRLQNDWEADRIDSQRWGRRLVWRALPTAEIDDAIDRLNATPRHLDKGEG